MNQDFKQYAEDLDDITVGEVRINKDGEFFWANEKAGRIARVESQRGRLREFLLQLCERLQCPEHAAEPKSKPASKSRAA